MKTVINTLTKTFLLALFFLPVLISCEKDDDNYIVDNPVTVNPADSVKLVISTWIYDWMNDVYYWNDMFPSDINIEEETDPEALFYELVYASEDRWSFITDDYETLESELSGMTLSMGYSPMFGLFTNTNMVFIVVEYIYPGSPAEAAGLKRGDIILTINGDFMDTTNYYDLYSQTSYTVGLGECSGNTIAMSGKTISMTAAIIDADPLIYDTIFNISGVKTGYIVYTEFITGSAEAYKETLDAVFDDFKSKEVSELIVDLRYNPGGEIDAAAYLASAISPASAVSNASVFSTFVYNAQLQNYYELTEGPESENLVCKFPANSHNINLDRVYFMTTYYTASASELLITGLEPYMDVRIVGEATYGKYVGSWLIYDDNEPRKHNWAIVPVVLKYANADGYTDFKNGLKPDHTIEDDLIEARPFGDTGDPMLAYALENITGTTIGPTIKSTRKGVSYKRLDSRIKSLKRNLIIQK
jgi:carboxyl-terminal processing protease